MQAQALFRGQAIESEEDRECKEQQETVKESEGGRERAREGEQDRARARVS